MSVPLIVIVTNPLGIAAPSTPLTVMLIISSFPYGILLTSIVRVVFAGSTWNGAFVTAEL